jgi:hypothetical protein
MNYLDNNLAKWKKISTHQERKKPKELKQPNKKEA